MKTELNKAIKAARRVKNFKKYLYGFYYDFKAGKEHVSLAVVAAGDFSLSR